MPSSTAQWWAKVGFVLAILLGFAAPIAAVAGLDNVAALQIGWVQMIGLGVTLAGIALTVLAQHSIGASWRIGVDPTEETALVTHGAFRSVRNPIFTAMLITAIGFVLLIPNIISMLAVVALFVSVEMQVRLVEESYLLNIQGSDYATYAADVGRFVSHPWTPPRPDRVNKARRIAMAADSDSPRRAARRPDGTDFTTSSAGGFEPGSLD